MPLQVSAIGQIGIGAAWVDCCSFQSAVVSARLCCFTHRFTE